MVSASVLLALSFSAWLVTQEGRIPTPVRKASPFAAVPSLTPPNRKSFRVRFSTTTLRLRELNRSASAQVGQLAGVANSGDEHNPPRPSFRPSVDTRQVNDSNHRGLQTNPGYPLLEKYKTFGSVHAWAGAGAISADFRFLKTETLNNQRVFPRFVFPDSNTEILNSENPPGRIGPLLRFDSASNPGSKNATTERRPSVPQPAFDFSQQSSFDAHVPEAAGNAFSLDIQKLTMRWNTSLHDPSTLSANDPSRGAKSRKLRSSNLPLGDLVVSYHHQVPDRITLRVDGTDHTVRSGQSVCLSNQATWQIQLLLHTLDATLPPILKTGPGIYRVESFGDHWHLMKQFNRLSVGDANHL